MSERIPITTLPPLPSSSRLPELRGPEERPNPQKKSSFGEIFKSVAERIDRGEALLERATHGREVASLDATKLIALQAGIYRYVETVDLTAKLIDRASNAVKTVLQGNH